jgi:hypothetical protein
VIYGGIFTHTNQVVGNARRSLEEFRKANKLGVESDGSLNPNQSITWQPPPRNLIKVN